MITTTDIQAHLRAVPFVPIRLTTSAGRTYDIVHPDFAFITRRYVHIGEAGPEEPTVPDKITWVSILHITAVENLPQPAAPPAPGANGTAA